MSLRDALLAKGLASKKDVRRVEQDLKRERKEQEGSQKRKAQLEREKAEADAREAAARLAARKLARAAYEEQKAQTEAALRVRNIVASNRIRAGGPIPWFHRVPHSARLNSLGVTLPIASRLQRGEMGIAALPTGNAVEYHVIRRTGAEKLAEIAPHLLVFWNADPTGISGKDQQPLQRDWQPALGPRRATEADIQRLTRPR